MADEASSLPVPYFPLGYSSRVTWHGEGLWEWTKEKISPFLFQDWAAGITSVHNWLITGPPQNYSDVTSAGSQPPAQVTGILEVRMGFSARRWEKAAQEGEPRVDTDRDGC